jgi:cytochrome b561
MVAPASALHGPLAWTLLALVGGHVAMAIFHDAVLRDRTIARMAG